MTDITPPHQRTNFIGHADIEQRIAQAIREGAFSNGWLISGGQGAGKATLAYRIARALLDPEARTDTETLQVTPDGRASALIAAHAHPDLFTANRKWDEKKDRFETEIPVDTIRALTSFLSRTASMGGWRVAIVDTADDLNRNAANALLKALEEPPARSVLMLLSAAPGRLLATIRSRCRRVELRPLENTTVASFLEQETAASGPEAARLAAVAKGRAGHAPPLALGEGAAASDMVARFLEGAMNNGDAGGLAGALSGRAADGLWTLFTEILIDDLSSATRAAAIGAPLGGPLQRLAVDQLLTAREELSVLIARGDGLNLDRGQLVMAMAQRLRAHAAFAAA